MGSIHNLIELLKSQIALYTDVRDILAEEKAAIIAWDLSGTNQLLKRKEKLTYKEKILEDARRCLVDRIKDEYNAEDNTLSSIIKVCLESDECDELVAIKDQLIEIVQSIHSETISLKTLYSTNIRIINEFNSQIGALPSNGYDKNRKPDSTSTSIQAIG